MTDAPFVPTGCPNRLCTRLPPDSLDYLLRHFLSDPHVDSSSHPVSPSLRRIYLPWTSKICLRSFYSGFLVVPANLGRTFGLGSWADLFWRHSACLLRMNEKNGRVVPNNHLFLLPFPLLGTTLSVSEWDLFRVACSFFWCFLTSVIIIRRMMAFKSSSSLPRLMGTLLNVLLSRWKWRMICATIGGGGWKRRVYSSMRNLKDGHY